MTTHTAKAETTLKVPFSFTVAGKTMPAGLYTVGQDTYHNMVVLKSQDASKNFSAVLVPGDPAPNDVHVALKFDTSGDTHVLKSIQYGSRVTTRLDRAPRETGYDPARLSQGR
jgi:hypothetical protein